MSLAIAGCSGGNPEAANALVASLIFDNASSDMRDALTSPVDYVITEDNFARWHEAEENLDQLPLSAIGTGSGHGRTAIARAVTRLESSPSARQAIESTGLSVRDFVLETIALAQATEAAQTGKSTSPTPILVENYQFVAQHRSGLPPAENGEAEPDSPIPAVDIEINTRELETAEMRMQQAAMEAERAAEVESQRELEELEERVQREIDAALERYDRRRLRHQLGTTSPDSLRQTR
ncbi:MAG: hypothetical protein NVSMB53_04980 [Gemmatimonadaceae bacterium]